MAGADGGGGAPPGQGGGAERVAPLGPEQLRRVLEQVTKAPPPPFELRDAAQRLRDAAQQAALQRGPGAQAPRLLPPQQLEAICVKVTRGKERPSPPLAAIQPKPERQSLLPVNSSSLVRLCVTSPQLLKAQSSGRTTSQVCFIRGPPKSPAPPVFVERSLPALQPVPAKRGKDPQVENGSHATLAASVSPTTAPVSSSSEHLFMSSLCTTRTEKLKKSLKVKTRSGRISRPPKYKAKDYKFIKTEDLADGHLSDSDDYSELSVEDEEEQSEKQVLFDVKDCALRPKAFKCQICEKSYIGKGGLARHFKLNPSHGQLEPEMPPCEKANGIPTQRYMEAQTRGLPSPEWSTPEASCREEARSAQSGLQNNHVEAEETMLPEPLGSEKYLEPARGELETLAESITADLQQSGAVQPHQGPAVTLGPSVSGSRAQLKESLQQCGREDLLELALPQLAQDVTLYEFLLVKVEKGHHAKPFFPAVYKEFEELHHMVKKLCQDHLSGSGPCSQEFLEINDDKVAESLGIIEFLRKKETYPDYSEPKPLGPEMDMGKLEEASGQKRERELGVVATGEGLAAVKRPRKASLPTDAPKCLATISGCQEKPGPSCAPAASKGLTPAARESFSPGSGGSCGEMISAGDRSTLLADQQPATSAFADFEARSESSGPDLLCLDVSEPASYVQLAEPEGPPPAQVSVFPEETPPQHAEDQAVAASQRIQSVCGGVEPLLPSGSGNTEAEDQSEMNHFHLNGHQPSLSHVLLMESEASPLQNILPANIMPAAYTCKVQGPQSGSDGFLLAEGGPQSGSDGFLSAEGGPQSGSVGFLSAKGGLSLGSQAGDLNQFPCGVEAHSGQRELENVAAVEEVLAFEISNRCQEVLSQAQEKIFIQTSDGLILSHPGTIVSQEEGMVLVPDAGGSDLRFGSPAVALEAVEAFLTVESEPVQ